MTTIYIIADINGKLAIATFEVSALDWIPMTKGDSVSKDSLPFRIAEVGISNEKGMFTQNTQSAQARRTTFR